MNQRYLKVLCTSINVNTKKVVKQQAMIPYYSKGIEYLPDVFPFNRNIYLSGDDGYNMRKIEFISDHKIRYFYNTTIILNNGYAKIRKMLYGEDMEFEFWIINEE